ncbi:MarR family transcriptional regulator [Vibrio rumoiensis]|uniref:MarR family transcriptional regulator n=1 Tax=Vibrio rumoiensis TaxID=76258 RepID=A0ABW7IZZ5_9VIBR
MQNLAKNTPIDARLSAVARLLPHQVNNVRLSKTQLRVLQSINMGEQVTAVEIANRCDVSTSFASTLLRTLMIKGYLKRKVMTERTGGVEFGYLVL